jgi:pimeloyl-ACP methyl ester carboxylesterase
MEIGMDLSFRTAGAGPPVLLIHGGAEDAGLLDAQAEAIAGRGFRTIWYDRRGTGGSTRADWPGGGADQHADDAADLLRAQNAVGATVLGFSSGGVVALALAARHPSVVGQVIAWEPASLGVLPNAAELHADLVAPIDAHLAAHPDDWRGAFHVMLGVLSGGRADLTSPAVRRMERNAEAVLRDDSPLLTTHVFGSGELPADRVTVAVGAEPDPLHGEIAARLGELTGKPPVTVPDADDHEIYVSRPEVLAAFLAVFLGHPELEAQRGR